MTQTQVMSSVAPGCVTSSSSDLQRQPAWDTEVGWAAEKGAELPKLSPMLLQLVKEEAWLGREEEREVTQMSFGGVTQTHVGAIKEKL